MSRRAAEAIRLSGVGMLKVIGYRPVQAAVVAALAALVTACAMFAPLYQRAVEQASVPVALAHAPASASQLRLTSTGILPDLNSGTEQTIPALSPAELAALVPARLRAHLRAPIAATSVVAKSTATDGSTTRGQLAWRAGACDHLTLASGACPTAAGQIAVSSADADNFGWQVGTRLPVDEILPPATPGPTTTTVLTITGVYSTPRSRFWDGWPLIGVSGTTPDQQHVAHDTWVTASDTFRAVGWRHPTTQADLPLDRARTGVDDLLRIGPEATAFERRQSLRPPDVASVDARSDLGALAATVATGRSQARATVPLLMMPLAVLGLVVLAMALGAAADQRRPELALARLRGRGVRGARAHLLRELLAVTLAGVPVGVGAALGLGWLARHHILPGHAPFELRPEVWAALGLAIVAVTTTTIVIGVRVSREPIPALLRRVPPRRTRWTLGTTDAIVLTAAIGILAAFTTGRLTGPLAVVAPGVIGLAGGVVLSRAIGPAASSAGRRLLRRGRLTWGTALLQVARRSGTRGVIALLTVSAGILVFAGNAVAVGARNRAADAAQQVGAPMVADLGDGTVATVREALSSAGVPAGAVTPVVVQPPTGYDTQANLFVDPVHFADVAALPPGAAAAIRALRSPPVAPVTVSGSRLTVDLATSDLATGGQPVDLAVQLLRADGSLQTASVGELTAGTSHRRAHVAIDCAATCTLTGWSVSAPPAASVTGALTLSHASVDGTPLDLGGAADWREVGADRQPGLTVEPGRGGGLDIAIDNQGRSDLLLQHRWVPTSLPAVVSGKLPKGSRGHSFTGTGLDGTDVPMRDVSRVAWLPSVGPDASVSRLDLAERIGNPLAQGAQLQLWFARPDSAMLARVTNALQAHHVAVGHVDRESRALAELAQSPSAWSLQLGVLVGAACVLVAALGLLVGATASWRARCRDLALLGLHGMSTRTTRAISLREQLPALVSGGFVGALSGVLAAHYSVPSLPLLPHDPAVDLLDLSIAWPTVVVLAACSFMVLGTLGWLLGAMVARRSTSDRVLGAS